MNFRNRTTLWLVFVVSIIMLWDNWQVYQGGDSLIFGSSVKKTAPATARQKRMEAREQALAEAKRAEELKLYGPSELIEVSTDLVKVKVDTRGGVIKYLELFNYRDATDKTRNRTLFDTNEPRTYLAQTGLIGGDFPNHKTGFMVKPGPRNTEQAKAVQLVLEGERNGVKLIKTFTLKRGDYAIDVKHEIINNSKETIKPSLYLQLLRDGEKPEGESKLTSTFTGPAVYTSKEKFEKIDFDEIEDSKTDHAKKADNGWFAMIQNHFVSAFIPAKKAEREIYTRLIDKGLYAVGNVLPLGKLAPGEKVVSESVLYAGPQDSLVMEELAVGLDLMKDYGLVTIVAKPLYNVLAKIHQYLGNWGWSIIALTVLIKLIFAPLSAYSYKSMANMKSVNPKIQEIRERYKGDKQQMNAAMMALYKTEKINPMGGCLPVVIQIPVFIALYWVLLASVEIVGAPWLGWITDLSIPDPYYILPLLMAGSMFIQQKMSPPPPDPLQAKIMMFVPVIFSVMFFFFPAGLVLYWVVNNVLSVGQQYYINKKYGGQPKKA